MKPLVLTTLSVGLLFLAAQGPAQGQGDLDRAAIEKSLRAVWTDRNAEIASGGALAAKDQPTASSAGQRICPIHRVPMLEFVIVKETAGGGDDDPVVVVRQVTAYFSPPGPAAFFRVEGKGTETAWYGPVADDRFPVERSGPIEIPMPDQPIISREMVTKALMRHVTDSGDQGFFENRFQDLREMGAPAVNHLFDIFETSSDAQMRHLAVEALGECARKDDTERMMRLVQQPANERYVLNLGVALHRLGETSVIDRMMENLEGALEQSPSNEQSSAIHAQMGLILSLCKKEDAALEHYQKGVELNPGNAIASYNLACSYSKLGRVDDAIASLETSLKAGYTDWEWMMIDGDLENARKDERFKELFLKYRK